MTQPQLILYIIKLVLGGLAAFFSIILWSRTRDPAWMSLVAGTVIGYAGIVYNMLLDFGVAATTTITVFGIPLTSLFFASVPSLLFIIAFILMIRRNK
ncbi:MAG: hypothetical protein II563_09225 [Treponema sp.]|jgi:hypothetical protein|nr:hypothetical protein [Treponema sp.]MBQ2553009.1 hypothetical protein [Treponema sp.]MBQ4237438.1 hypothetical protein [Treponema sp.]MBQ5383821.1 hypothetical protein [Treponema sp.]